MRQLTLRNLAPKLTVMEDKPIGWERAHRAAIVIEAARKSRMPRMSIRAAAAASGYSGQWWTIMATGKEARGGRDFWRTAPDETLLRMARAVGVVAQVRDILGLAAEDVVRPPIVTATEIRDIVARDQDVAEQIADILNKIHSRTMPPPPTGGERNTA